MPAFVFILAHEIVLDFAMDQTDHGTPRLAFTFIDQPFLATDLALNLFFRTPTVWVGYVLQAYAFAEPGLPTVPIAKIDAAMVNAKAVDKLRI